MSNATEHAVFLFCVDSETENVTSCVAKFFGALHVKSLGVYLSSRQIGGSCWCKQFVKDNT